MRKTTWRSPTLENLELRRLLSVTPGQNPSVGDQLTTLRLALASTAEFTALNGGAGPTATVLQEIVDDVNDVYGRELAVQFELVNNNSLLTFTDEVTDGYTNGTPFTMSQENQTVVDAVIGSANYDLGHVIGTRPFAGAEGIGFIGLGSDLDKAKGASLLSDAHFAEDIFVHELGHQMGAIHSFNGVNGSCSFGRESLNSYEPGSGSTIMSYQGICGTDDLTSELGDKTYFGAASFVEITDRIATFPAVGSKTSVQNSIPTVSAGADFSIPTSTPFELNASGADSDPEDKLTVHVGAN